MKIRYFFIICLFFLFISNSFAQDSTKIPKVKITELGNNLYEISLLSCNSIVSAGPDGILIVDANYKEAGKYLKAEIEKLKRAEINYIINTHWHFDHVGGNEILANAKTIIIAHEDARNLLLKDQFLLGDTIKALPKNALPNKTFIGSYDMSFNGEKIDLLPVSGSHSAGDIIVYFKNSNVLHIGDLVFADMFPYVDYEHGGSAFTLERNLQIIIDMLPDDIRIVPGHGRIYSREDLRKYKEMISSTISIVKVEKDKGKSLDEIQKADVLKDWKNWGIAFTCNDWIEIIYKSK
jgi:cyclase